MSEFRRLIDQEVPRLRRYARALARDPVRADELVLETIARALVNQRSWKSGTKIGAWLLKIMHTQNLADVHQKRTVGLQKSDLVTVADNPLAAPELLELELALARISLEQHEVILLVGLEGMSYEETAQILKIPVEAVRSRLTRARAVLRKQLEMKKHRDEMPQSRAA